MAVPFYQKMFEGGGKKKMDEMITIYGYDKDNDIYEPVAYAPTMEKAKFIAAAVMERQKNVEELRRDGHGEPFDWFVIGLDDEVVVFTSENTKGIYTRKKPQNKTNLLKGGRIGG